MVQVPFSHSIVTSYIYDLILGAWVGLFIPWRAGTTASAVVFTIALSRISQQATRQIVKAKSVIQLTELQQNTVKPSMAPKIPATLNGQNQVGHYSSCLHPMGDP
tara:strand:- start:313 stop:627 length:315 start_codon:yes stop_codon:yes gene_type:complete